MPRVTYPSYDVQPELSYQRPSDWLPLPIISQEEEKFSGLFAVYNVVGNFIALSFEGDYTVDWGDGSIENVSSGVVAEHSYDYSAISPDTLSSRGYKQVVVTVTPQAGSNLTSIDLNVRHTNLPVTGGDKLSTAWLDISFSMPLGENIYLSSGVNHYLGSLEIARIVNAGICSDFYNLFYYCTSLKEVVVEKMDFVEDVSFMFEYCSSLVSVTLPDCPSLLLFYNMFYGAYSVKFVTLGDVSNAEDFSSILGDCGSLVTATIKKVSGSGYYAFGYCYALKEVNILDASELTDTLEMFSNCYSLEKFHLPASPLLDYTEYMFDYCLSLKSASFEDLSGLTDSYGMFYSCESLEKVSLLNLSMLEYGGYTFEQCFSLKSYNFSVPALCSSLSSAFSYCTGLHDLAVSGFAPEAEFTNLAWRCYSLQKVVIDGQPGYCGNMFAYCGSLRKVTFTDCSQMWGAGLFYNCNTLSSLRVPNIAVSFDLTDCLLSRDALVQVFNDLGEVVGETVSVQGNWGTPFLTPSDIQIALDKGWSVST